MSKYSESTIRRKALDAGYRVSKGFQRYLCGNAVRTLYNGERPTGYIVEDLSTGFMIWGCYDHVFDHLWDLSDVEDFLIEVYENSGLVY